MIKYTARLYGFANWKDHVLFHKLIVSGNSFKNFQKYRMFRFTRVDFRNAAGVVEGFATHFQARKSVFHKNWVHLDLNVDGHIPLVLKPLTFNNVFGANIDLSSLNYIAPRVTNKPDSGHDIFHQMTLGG